MIVAHFDLAPYEAVREVLNGASPQLTWHGLPGLWCALHGESILDAGLHGLTARYDGAWAHRLMTNDIATDQQWNGVRDRRHGVLTCWEHRPVSPGRADALEREGYLPKLQTENYRLLGAGASYFSVLSNNGLAAERCGAYFAADIGVWPSTKELQPKRKRRLRRHVHSARRLDPRTSRP